MSGCQFSFSGGSCGSNSPKLCISNTSLNVTTSQECCPPPSNINININSGADCCPCIPAQMPCQPVQCMPVQCMPMQCMPMCPPMAGFGFGFQQTTQQQGGGMDMFMMMAMMCMDSGNCDDCCDDGCNGLDIANGVMGIVQSGLSMLGGCGGGC